MKKICFGSVFTLLCQMKKGCNQETLYGRLVTPYDESGCPHDKGSVGNRKSGKYDFPEKDYFTDTTRPIEEIIMLYRTGLEKTLKSKEYKSAFVVAIQDILRDDPIAPDTAIGSEGYTKRLILDKNTFDFYVLIANLMKYCSAIENAYSEENVKEISKSFLADRITRGQKIHIQDEVLNAVEKEKLDLTIDAATFSRVFTEINPDKYSLALLNPNRIKIFKLRIGTKEFDKADICGFILDNISFYVYSRTKRQDIESKHNVRTLSFRAVNELKRSAAYKTAKETFCEMMLYSFMESSMHAPKILSGFEVRESGTAIKKSAGIYLLPAGGISNNNQIVFGCSQAHDKLMDAIDDVLNQALSIKNNKANEIQLLDPSVLRANLTPEATEYVRDIIRPTRSTDMEADDAFGIFVSYSINVPNRDTLSLVDYRKAVEAQMDVDIVAQLPHIKEKIEELGLKDHSFYLFVLPLDSVESDTSTIMDFSAGGI